MQEIILALPYQMALPYISTAPNGLRPLKLDGKGIQKKTQDYLALADILLRRFPTDLGGRAAQFLLELCRDKDPGEVPRLSWFTTGGVHDQIDINKPPNVVAKVIPRVRFQAVFR